MGVRIEPESLAALTGIYKERRQRKQKARIRRLEVNRDLKAQKQLREAA
jgi:hypothetical protein